LNTKPLTYPFGSVTPGRSFTSESYRYGFNGKEKDGETVSTSGGTYDFDARIYNPSLGRWLSVDPKFKMYPAISPFVAFGNNPIYYIDPSGETLRVAGNKAKALNDLKMLVPTTYRDALKMTKKGQVYFDMSAVPDGKLEADPGLTLVSNLIESDKNYEYNVSNIAKSRLAQVAVKGGEKVSKADKNSQVVTQDLTKAQSDPVAPNFGVQTTSKTPKDEDRKLTLVPEDLSLDGQTTIPAKTEGTIYRDKTLSSPKARIPLIFHELSELYYRTDKKQGYTEAHENATQDEKNLPEGDWRRDNGNEGKAGLEPKK